MYSILIAVYQRPLLVRTATQRR